MPEYDEKKMYRLAFTRQTIFYVRKKITSNYHEVIRNKRVKMYVEEEGLKG